MSKKIKKKSNIKNIANSILLAALSTSAVSIHAAQAPTLEQAVAQMMLNRQTYTLQEAPKDSNPKVKNTNEDVELTKKFDTKNQPFLTFDKNGGSTKNLDFSSAFNVNTIGDNDYKVLVDSVTPMQGIKGPTFVVGTDKATIVSSDVLRNTILSLLRSSDANAKIKLELSPEIELSNTKTRSTWVVMSPFAGVGTEKYAPESLNNVKIDEITAPKGLSILTLANDMTQGSFTLPATAPDVAYKLIALPLTTTKVTFENVLDTKGTVLPPTAAMLLGLEILDKKFAVPATFNISGPKITTVDLQPYQEWTVGSSTKKDSNDLEFLSVSKNAVLSIAGDTKLINESFNLGTLNIAGKDVAAEKEKIESNANQALQDAEAKYKAATPEQQKAAQAQFEAQKTQIETDKHKALLAAEAGTHVVLKNMGLGSLSKTVLQVPQGQKANFTLSDTQFANGLDKGVVNPAVFGTVAVQKGGTLLIGGNNVAKNVNRAALEDGFLRLELDTSNAKKTVEGFNLALSGTGQVSYDDIKLNQVEIDATEYGATISASAKYKNVKLKGVSTSGLKEVKGARNIAWADNYSPQTPVNEAIARINALQENNAAELAVVADDIARLETAISLASAQIEAVPTQVRALAKTAATSIKAATGYSAAITGVAPLAKQYGIYSVQGQKNNVYTVRNMVQVNIILGQDVYTTTNLTTAISDQTQGKLIADLTIVKDASIALSKTAGFKNYNDAVGKKEIYADDIFVEPKSNTITPVEIVAANLVPNPFLEYQKIYSSVAFPAIDFVSSSIMGGATNSKMSFKDNQLVEADGTPYTAGLLLETGVITGEVPATFTPQNIAATAGRFQGAFPDNTGGVSFELTDTLAAQLNAILPSEEKLSSARRNLGVNAKGAPVIQNYVGGKATKTPAAFFNAEQTTNAVADAREEADAVPVAAVKSIPLTEDLPEEGINATTQVGRVNAWNEGIKNAKDRAEARAPEVIPIEQKEVERLKLMLAALKAKQNSLTTANSLYTDKIKTLESQQKAFSAEEVLVGNKDVVFDAAPNIVAYGAQGPQKIAEVGADKYTAFQLQELNVSGEAKVHEVVGVSNLDKVEFVGARQTKNLFADEDVTDITFAGDVIFDGPSNANKSLFLTTEDVQTKINQLNTDLDSQQKQLVKAQTDKDNAAIATLTTQIAVTGADIQAYGAMKSETAANPNNLTIKGTTTFVGEYNAEAKGAIILGDGQGKDELFTSPKAADAKEAKMLTFKAPSFQINGSGVNLNFTTIAIDATTATVKGGGSDASTYEMATHVDGSGASGKFVAKNGALAFDPTVSTVSINVDSDLKAMLPADKRNIIVVENATMDDKAKVLANNDANKLVGVFTGVYTKGVDKTKGSISLKQLVVSESTAATQANIVKQLDNNQYTKENVTAVAAIQATYGKDATSFYNQNFTGVNAGEAIDSSEWGKGLNLVAKALQGSEADQVAFAKSIQKDQAETTSATTAVLVNTLQSGADGLGNRLVGVGGGDEDGKANTGIWANVFFNSGVGQKNADLTGGYNANGISGVVGADHAFSDNVIMGAAIGFANSNIKAKEKPEENYSKINAILFSVYGHFDINKNIFSDVILSYGNNKITSNSYEALNAGKFEKVTTPSYNNNNIVAQAKFGYNVVLGGGINFRPQAGLQYLNIGALDYTRTGVDSKTPITTKTDAQHNISGLIGGTISTDLPQGNKVFTPEAHVLAALSFGNKTSKIVNTYEDTILLTEGTLAAPKSNVNFGASLKAVHDNIEGSIGGDVLIGNKFTGYQGSLKVRVNL